MATHGAKKANIADKLFGLTAGERMRLVRKELGLTMRHVHAETVLIAQAAANEEFIVRPSRLCAIENHGCVPNVYRLHALALVYGLRLEDVLDWFGISPPREKPFL